MVSLLCNRKNKTKIVSSSPDVFIPYSTVSNRVVDPRRQNNIGNNKRLFLRFNCVAVYIPLISAPSVSRDTGEIPSIAHFKCIFVKNGWCFPVVVDGHMKADNPLGKQWTRYNP